jgi:chemotaxis protein MotB
MARRKKIDEHANHERWLVSYADFITLLFAFFVVMYSISSVNEGKYRVLSDSISAAFDPSSQGLPIKFNNPLKPPIVSRAIQSSDASRQDPNIMSLEMYGGIEASEEDKINLEKITSRVEKGLEALIDKNLIKVNKNDLWVEIEIKSTILFPSGVAKLQSRAVPVMKKIAKIIGDADNQVQVEGFTDNVPIDTVAFPSNWELSAARAASVVHLFARENINPRRLSAVGYGEFKAIASNDTASGRRQNRRIKIIVLSDAIARRTNRSEQLDKTVAAKRKIENQRKSNKQPQNATSPNLIVPLRPISNSVRP